MNEPPKKFLYDGKKYYLISNNIGMEQKDVPDASFLEVNKIFNWEKELAIKNQTPKYTNISKTYAGNTCEVIDFGSVKKERKLKNCKISKSITTVKACVSDKYGIPIIIQKNINENNKNSYDVTYIANINKTPLSYSLFEKPKLFQFDEKAEQ